LGWFNYIGIAKMHTILVRAAVAQAPVTPTIVVGARDPRLLDFQHGAPFLAILTYLVCAENGPQAPGMTFSVICVGAAQSLNISKLEKYRICSQNAFPRLDPVCLGSCCHCHCYPQSWCCSICCCSNKMKDVRVLLRPIPIFAVC
jgi:hypothetical protein